ncbi:MAG: hypothetical protein SGCHY_004692 [Lobulomycetales sp.]
MSISDSAQQPTQPKRAFGSTSSLDTNDSSTLSRDQRVSGNGNEESMSTISNLNHQRRTFSESNIGLAKEQPSFYSLSSTTKSQFVAKNKEVHRIFRQLPEDDYYVGEAVCALQKEILLQGKLYLTERHFCFHANIFGFVTSLMIPIADVHRVEKRKTILISNAISVSTNDAWYFFTSLMNRDKTFDKMISLRKAFLAAPSPPRGSEREDGEGLDDTAVEARNAIDFSQSSYSSCDDDDDDDDDEEDDVNDRVSDKNDTTPPTTEKKTQGRSRKLKAAAQPLVYSTTGFSEQQVKYFSVAVLLIIVASWVGLFRLHNLLGLVEQNGQADLDMLLKTLVAKEI